MAALTLLQRGSYIRTLGDVAELADAQVSEACDGDIVEVQVLSSPPCFWASPDNRDSPFLICYGDRANRSDTPNMKPLNTTSTIEHKHKGLPRFVCIPTSKVDPWKLQGTTTVEVTMNGVNVGRRSLKRWDVRGCWWMDLADAVCRKANVDTGDRVELILQIASEELPEELAGLIKKNSGARTRWEALTPGQRRVLREEILAAKLPATRARRAARALGVEV